MTNIWRIIALQLSLVGLTACGGETSPELTEQSTNNVDNTTSTPSISVPAQSNTTRKINDTGLDRCYPYSSNKRGYQKDLVDCTLEFTTDGDPIPRGQDGMYGRDSDQATNPDSDGRVGFSFTKLGASGEALPLSAERWFCVKDNVTGLIWEVKTGTPSLHRYDERFTWYSPDTDTNGGVKGNRIGSSSCYGKKADEPSTYCNTYNFVRRVNQEQYCGRSDWRLPSTTELIGLYDFGTQSSLKIDSDFFPFHEAGQPYWTADTYALSPSKAWQVKFGGILNFMVDVFGYKSSSARARLVAG